MGGFDSRKVVVWHLSPFMTEEQLYEAFSPVGDIMGMHLPRDYDTPPQFGNFDMILPKALQKFHLRKEISSDQSGYTTRSALNDIRVYIKSEIADIKFRLETRLSSNEIKGIFEDLYDL